MKFFRKNDAREEVKHGTSTATWHSIASGDGTHLTYPDDGDHDAGFLNPSSSTSKVASAWSRERMSQQLELEGNVDAREMGCCSRCLELAIKAILVIDAAIGRTFIVYGCLLYTKFDQPAMAAVVFCLVFGSIHLATSMMGIFSYMLKICSRCGLVVSAFAAPYVAIVYATIVIALLVDSFVTWKKTWMSCI